MPTLIEYPQVLEQLTRQGMRCLYYNSGAFGFDSDVVTHSRGWIGEEDSSIRESARAIVRNIPEPQAATMCRVLIQVWQACLPGPVWLMPKSHWAYELDYGSRDWLPDALSRVGVDVSVLLPLNNAMAVEFTEPVALQSLVEQLLINLKGSDFQLVFPGRNTICTIHHRCQLWWTTTDLAVLNKLDEAVEHLSDGRA